MPLNLDAGLSGIRASQTAIDTISQNIVNANTPGYHRQSVRLTERLAVQRGRNLIGQGVRVASIQRIRSEIIEEALTRNVSDRSAADEQLAFLQRIESLFDPINGSLVNNLESMFNRLQRLTTAPGSATTRDEFIRSASSFAEGLQYVDGSLSTASAGLDADIRDVVAEINLLFADIVDINRNVSVAEGRGLVPNDLHDQREQLVNDLAVLIDPNVDKQGPGLPVIQFAERALLVGSNPVTLELAVEPDGTAVIRRPGTDETLSFASGRLAAMLSARNGFLNDYRDQLDALARGVMQAMDSLHSTGVGPAGSFTQLMSTRSINDVTRPLSDAETAFPVAAGELFVSVTDRSTGQRTLTSVSLDPATQSLQDVAALISAVDHLQAVVDPQAGRMSIISESGFEFDFSGLPQTLPDLSAWTGSGTPTVGGKYLGPENTQLTFSAVGTGTIGTTDGLRIEVRDRAGSLVTTLEVGAGYEPGSVIDVGHGITVRFESGLVTTGDAFTAQLIANPDEPGLLTSLGLNTLFTGSAANDIALSARVLENRNALATSYTGDVGDTRNIESLLAIRDVRLFDGDSRTAGQFVADMTGRIGQDVRETRLLSESLQAVGQQIDAERNSVSGVDLNEEMISLLRFQQSFQAASRIITTIDRTIDDLLQIVR